MIRGLLSREPADRVRFACGQSPDELRSSEALAQLTYQPLRAAPLFCAPWPEGSSAQQLSGEEVREAAARPATRVPSLRDLCVRAVGRAAVSLAHAVAQAGGVRPDVAWMKRFDLRRLLPVDRQRVMHYLDRKRLLGNPSVLRLFHASLPDARCLRASTEWREVVGMAREVQGDWSQPFHFLQLPAPRLCAGAALSARVAALKAAVSKVNKLRPRLCVVSGELTAHRPEEPGYSEEVTQVRHALARLSESIHLVVVPGPADVGLREGLAVNLAAYRALFGADYFGFWCGALRGLVVNSSLLLHPGLDPEASLAQEAWLEEEVEQCKLCAGAVALFSHHRWFRDHVDEDDSPGIVPRAVRRVWLQRLRHHKVKFIFTGAETGEEGVAGEARPFPRALFPPPPPSKEEEDVDDDEEEEEEEHEEEEKKDEGKAREEQAEGKEEQEREEETPFTNEENDYEGPRQLAAPGSGEDESAWSVRAVRVAEDSMEQRVYIANALPAALTELAAQF